MFKCPICGVKLVEEELSILRCTECGREHYVDNGELKPLQNDPIDMEGVILFNGIDHPFHSDFNDIICTPSLPNFSGEGPVRYMSTLELMEHTHHYIYHTDLNN